MLTPAVAIGTVLMLVLAMLGTETTTGSSPSQPGSASDAAASRFLPTGWYQVLTAAAGKTSGRSSDTVVPWTVLAGLAKSQTDFGRYSPYDADDRDPGRTAPDTGTPGSTLTGATSGGGPGPISGVSGPGNAATLDPAHPAPPTGDLAHQAGWFLYALRMHESNGNYTDKNPDTGACGAYQYLTSTWNNYGGYPTACDAPPSVQDARKTSDVLSAWAKYHSWQEVTMSHYYPVWATTPAQWVNSPTAGKYHNPTGWAYVDDVMTRMAAAAATPATGSPIASGPPVPTVPTPSGVLPGPISPVAPGANGCPVANPNPPIGGTGQQGVGPFLLTPAAAADMRAHHLDPNNPCDSANYVADKLSRTADTFSGAPGVPKWVPDGNATDQQNARTRWTDFIARSGLFVDRSWTPGQPCALPPADPGHPQSISFQITYIWHCQIVRSPSLYLITGAGYDDKGTFTYTVDPDRSDTEQRLVNEALDVSYGSGGWSAKCDTGSDDREGVFPMTKAEAAAAGVTDRCDTAQNIDGAAKLVLSGEVQLPSQRPKTKGQYEPMIGGWEKLSIAMGADGDQFSLTGPGAQFTSNASCDQAMTAYLTALAPQAGAFATLTAPPAAADLAGWENQLLTLENTGHLTDPGNTPACTAGAWAPGFDEQLAQLATGLASPPPTTTGAPGAVQGPTADPAIAKNLSGLANYFLAEGDAIVPANPAAGTTTLVIPRLAPRPMNTVSAPLDADALAAWNTLGTSSGVQTPLPTLAVEWAWFYGGVISPFNSAGQLIGSLQNASADTGDTSYVPAQITIGPDGCPTSAPPNTLRDGADKIGIAKICADAVAQAPTPEAALAIKWALTHLGWAYSQDKRMTDGYADCSSFVSRAYHDGAKLPIYKSWAPVTVGFVNVKWTKPVTIATSRPGDLMLPFPGHIAMQLTDGYKVQTNQTGDVSKVDRTYTSAWAVVRIIPALVTPADP